MAGTSILATICVGRLTKLLVRHSRAEATQNLRQNGLMAGQIRRFLPSMVGAQQPLKVAFQNALKSFPVAAEHKFGMGLWQKQNYQLLRPALEQPKRFTKIYEGSRELKQLQKGQLVAATRKFLKETKESEYRPKRFAAAGLPTAVYSRKF